MACGSCSVGKDGKPGGCSGNCSGGCNRMNTFDWLTALDIEDIGTDEDLVEVTFNNGARKDFFHNPKFTNSSTGDWILVEIAGGNGYDIGKISLANSDLVRLQMKKKGIKDNQQFQKVIRRANQRDLEKLEEIRALEKPTLVRARAIARTLDLDMKLGDIEYQGDGRKATFFYTADGRVDFRELIRHYAKEFKVKIEMRQIGARQESSRIGGIGSCGRELCCSTWLSDFKSVSTAAARYQQLAINQAKLSGMCGRLKCCLNYELDTYLDALDDFPEKAERLKTHAGNAVLIKTDVFKRLMTYVMDSGIERGKFYTLAVEQVKMARELNVRGEMPPDLKELQAIPAPSKSNRNKHIEEDEGDEEDYDEPDVDYEDVIGAVELSDDKRKKKKKKKKKVGDKPAETKMVVTKVQSPNPPRSEEKDAKPEAKSDAPRDNTSNPNPNNSGNNFNKNKKFKNRNRNFNKDKDKDK